MTKHSHQRTETGKNLRAKSRPTDREEVCPACGAVTDGGGRAGSGHGDNPEGSVRERLLQAAADVFTTKGYAAASVSEIVAAAGVTKPVLYYYFRSKEGIYLEILETAFGAMDEALAKPYGHSTVKERMLALFDDIVVLCQAHSAVIRLIHAIYYGPPQGAPHFDFHSRHMRFLARIRELVDEGVASGEFRAADPGDASLAILGVVSFCLDCLQCSEFDDPIPPDHRRLLEYVFRGLAR